MIEEHIITLRIKVDLEDRAHPAEWAWNELLDLGGDEDVEVIETPGDHTGQDWSK